MLKQKAKRSHSGGYVTKSPSITVVKIPFDLDYLKEPPKDFTNEDYNKNLNVLNQLMGRTRGLLREIYFEARSPSMRRERLDQLEGDIFDVLKDFLSQARGLH